MRAVDVLLSLIRDDLRLPSDYFVELVDHDVGRNWRQLHETPREQIDAIEDALVQAGPFGGRRIRVAALEPVLSGVTRGVASIATSVSSRVWDQHGRRVGHLAIMNLHPVGFHSQHEVEDAVVRVVGYPDGYLLSSGRHFHYYGRRLLSNADWLKFLAQFLMPCTLVSPRYIGHSLYRGFCTLRLNAVPPFKPHLPTLVRAAD